MALDMVSAHGSWITDRNGKNYLDLISGISVSNLGHGNQAVLKAIHDQVDHHLHLMVYGEYVQQPQSQLANLLADKLGHQLNKVYLVNSGNEAIDGAVKLAKRVTGRPKIASFFNAYHGSGHAALSLMGNETYKRAFRPLLPGVYHLHYNQEKELAKLDRQTAAVVVEVVQAEAGYVPGQTEFLQLLRKRCTELGILLVVDEIQTGFGRTGALFAFQQIPSFKPDIVCLAKGLGGGMPIGAFVANDTLMNQLQQNPILGHITTFGGHPVSAAAAVATIQEITNHSWIKEVAEKEELLRSQLKHPAIREVRGKGLLLAVQLDSFGQVQQVIKKCIAGGVLTDWFLFNETALRLAPPLNATPDELSFAANVIVESL